MSGNRCLLYVLVPVRDYECSALVKDLHRQGEGLGVSFEVIVGYDASENDRTMAANRELRDLPQCLYWECEENLGRARMRNLLAECAKGVYLLFVDCDAALDGEDFLKRYLGSAEEGSVLCGSLKNVQSLPSEDVSLRFYYEKAADRHRGVEERNKSPYHWLTTFNFLMPRDLFLSVRFEEKIVQYGYEDTYFAMQLEQRGIPVKHIDNPLVHLGLDANSVFLKKTETALQTLASLDEDMQKWASVSRLAHKLERCGLGGVLRVFHSIFSSRERRNLLSKCPNLLIFKLYKLGYYMSLPRK